jgi:hypothetical protein
MHQSPNGHQCFLISISDLHPQVSLKHETLVKMDFLQERVPMDQFRDFVEQQKEDP